MAYFYPSSVANNEVISIFNVYHAILQNERCHLILAHSDMKTVTSCFCRHRFSSFFFFSFLFPCVGFHIPADRGELTSWDEIWSVRGRLGQLGVSASKYYTIQWCCLGVQTTSNEPCFSLASSLKDSGHIRPGGVCEKCNGCQHECGHSRGQQHSNPLAKVRVLSFNTMYREMFPSHFFTHKCVHLNQCFFLSFFFFYAILFIKCHAFIWFM